jgi:FkbM family methyltransferase
MSHALLRKILNKNNYFFYTSIESRNYQTLKSFRERMISVSEGVLHIGAHEGQERGMYSNLGVRVMWIEADPEIYSILVKNISRYNNQKAVNILLGSKNKRKHEFYTSSNNKESSSIYNFGDGNSNKELKMIGKNFLQMKTLSSCFLPKTISLYPHWVIDVQGAELAVLKGAEKLLNFCYSLEVEVTSQTLNLYEGGSKVNEIVAFLKSRGFTNIQNTELISHGNLNFVRVRGR